MLEDPLLRYYEHELTYLRRMGAEFADKYPKIASRLMLETGEGRDPHVERLLEGAAFLAARIHRKLDDDFPEITNALLNVVYPHYLRPIPSMSVVQFELDPEQGKLTTGLKIPRDSPLAARPVDGIRYKFRTCFDTTLWPLDVHSAQWLAPSKLDPPVRGIGAVAVVRLEIRCHPEIAFDKLGLDSLRFFLHGEDNQGGAASLYEVLVNNCVQILIRDPRDRRKAPVRLPVSCLEAAGFAENEAMLPYPRLSFDGYRLLQEYFSFPDKFQFLDLNGLGRLASEGFRDRAEILFFLSPFEREERWQMLESITTPKMFRLGCSPIVNLFSITPEPIRLKQTEVEYVIVPDARHHRTMEVFSVDSVVSFSPGTAETVAYEPFYSFRHDDHRDKKQTFWHSTRRPTPWSKDKHSELYLTLVDLSGRPRIPDADAVTVRVTCTNRDLPQRLPVGHALGDFELEGGSSIKRVNALLKLTPSFPPPPEAAAFWRLISHLSLNYLSLVAEGREALQEILRLYKFTEAVHSERQIQAIRSVSSKPHFSRVVSENGVTFARGTLVEMEIDEEHFSGAGVFLFANVLDRFLAMYTSLNSFTQLEVRTSQRKEALKRWPARAGRKILL
ncbi:MAG: type VI secretion system baseplate subunit TssF [Bryobacteraceae bacterium]